MAKELKKDDLLQVSGGLMDGLTYEQILQEIAAYLQEKGFSTGNSSEEELQAVVSNMSYDQVVAMKNYLWNTKNIANSSLPMWLQSVTRLTNGLDTENLIDSLTKGN